MTYDQFDLIARLRLARQRAGYTQAEAAAQLYLSTGHLSHLERGHYGLSLDHLLAFAELYGVSVAWLLTGDNEADALRRTVRRLEDENARLRHELLCARVGVEV